MTTNKDVIQVFDSKKVRTIWDSKNEKWYFSIVDVVAALTDSVRPQDYWRKLKQRLRAEGNQTVTSCHGLKLIAPDGKMRLTDVAEDFTEHKNVGRKGGSVAYDARKKLELNTGRKVVTEINAKPRLKSNLGK